MISGSLSDNLGRYCKRGNVCATLIFALFAHQEASKYDWNFCTFIIAGNKRVCSFVEFDLKAFLCFLLFCGMIMIIIVQHLYGALGITDPSVCFTKEYV